MKWLTRSHVHVDRVACPWLISRFVDSEAEFLFVPKSQIDRVARETGAPVTFHDIHDLPPAIHVFHALVPLYVQDGSESISVGATHGKGLFAQEPGEYS